MSIQQSVGSFLVGQTAAPVEAEAGGGDAVLEPGLERGVEDRPAFGGQGRGKSEKIRDQVVLRVHIGFRDRGKRGVAKSSHGGL